MISPKIRAEDSGNPRTRGRQASPTENPVGARILSALGDRSRKWLATEADLPESTVGDAILRGPAKTDVALKIADVLNVSLDWLLGRAGEDGTAQIVISHEQSSHEGGDIVKIPVHDVEVAAGAGRLINRLPPPIYYWTFSKRWLETNLFGVGHLIMVYVAGSSQEPELSDGDVVAIDLHQNRIREGMFVVRLDDTLVLKHIQLDGRIVKLVSRNPLYDPVSIDLTEPDIENRFEVVGRAVWAGKML
ncbi:helix-turn-helix domain-containing protein [Sphingomonas paucimobilis]|uniref:DNA, contig: SP630 n=1 Tax=Sphingomonas paucimobilis NBRC 13935 TaxID=1219050 RepID=A0A0C9MTW4_SPHPI|nr:S24 family peptidase [Sphingomonas paucimobilis]QPS15789.1 helix-turn-helix domain-containing protein [Sphingomonas paucimobilis]GAN14141.1 putative transcriptional regulator [Sphingomonas paucimobilis NBRC 13935]SUJ08191.1 LexA repressor [Sphingomonas paucimobilis]